MFFLKHHQMHFIFVANRWRQVQIGKKKQSLCFNPTINGEFLYLKLLGIIFTLRLILLTEKQH